MPFVSSDNSTHETDRRKIFIGRNNELVFFEQSILEPEKPLHNIISITGDAGVGKSSLLAQFRDKALAPGFKERCLIAQVGEKQVTPISIMEKVSSQFRIAGYPLINFETVLREYKEMMRKLQIINEISLRDRISKPTSLLLSELDLEDEEEQVKRGWKQKEQIQSEHNSLFKDIDRTVHQINELTKAFVDELNQLANTPIVVGSLQAKRQRRILLFFDPFEQLAAEAVPWLLDYFLEADISRNIVLIIAGHVSLERSYPKYLRNWLPYRDNNDIYPIPLKNFTEEETHEYLAAQNIIDTNHVTTLWRMSHGLPLYLSLLAYNSHAEIDPTKEIVDAFLSGLYDDEELKRRLALDVSLFSKSFNQDDLEALSYLTEENLPTLYRWLTTQSFVSSNLQDGRYSYHELAREIFSRYLYQSPRRCQATRRALVEYYLQLLDKIPFSKSSTGTIREVSCTPEQLELVLALITQLLLLPEEADHINGIEQVLSIYQFTNTEQDGELIKILRQLSQAQPNNQASPNSRQIAANLLQYIETAQTKRRQEFIASANYLLGQAAHKTSFSPELLARIYYEKGRAYYSLDKEDAAIAECNQAIRVDGSFVKAYILRGKMYTDLKRYEDALTDFCHALELSPEDTWALLERGRIYRYQGYYEDALQDFYRSVELDPSFEHQGYEQIGLTLHTLRRYQEATEAFVRALKLEATCSSSWISLAKAYEASQLHKEIPRLLKEIPVSKSSTAAVIVCKAEALSATGHYSNALEYLDYVLKLSPKNSRILVIRGKVHYKLSQFEKAEIDLTRAIELKPDDVPALIARGRTFRKLGIYQKALQDFNRAIRISPKTSRPFLDRGIVYRKMELFKEALQDFDTAIELDPASEHEVQKERGLVFQSLKKPQEAAESFIKGINKHLVCSECWTALAITYRMFLSNSEIPKLLREIPIPNADMAEVIDCRGEALRSIGHYEEALTDFDCAIELNPENTFALSHRGLTYYSMYRYEEALQDFHDVINIDSNDKHTGYEEIGIVFQALERYKEAIDAFIEALKILPTCKRSWSLLTRTYEALYPRNEIPILLREISLPDADTASIIAKRAYALKTTGHYEEALVDFTRAIEVEPNNVETTILRGQVYSHLKNYEKALIDFSNVLTFKPDHAKATFLRGQTMRYLGRYVEAFHDLDHAIQLDHQYRHASQKEKGKLYFSQGKYQKAIDAFIKALTASPTCEECFRLLARIYEASYSRNEVPRLLRETLIPDANTASVITSRADSLSNLGYYKEALDDLNRLSDLNINAKKHYCVAKGLVFSYLEKYDKAVENYQIALEEDPNHYHCLYNLAVTIICWKGAVNAQVEIDAAYTALKRIQYTDEQGSALYGLGGLEALLGNSDQALNYLKQAILLEDNAIIWAKNDIAWHKLRKNEYFEMLISEENEAFASLTPNAQSKFVRNLPPVSQETRTMIKPNLTKAISMKMSKKSHIVEEKIIQNTTNNHSFMIIQRNDVDRLTNILANRAANAFEGSRRFFRDIVCRTDLPQRWIQEIADVWTGNANHDAQELISWSISKGINPNNIQFTTLGSILKVLLPDVGLNDARIIAILIVVYNLYLDRGQRENIAIRYQVPQEILADSQQPKDSSGSWQGPIPTDELELQSWLKPEPDMLDVGLLIHAIEQTAAVCRIELIQKRRYGTGFLIAPNLLLTNYHVLKFYNDENLEENASNALLRFGCITANEGQAFKLIPKPVLRWSQTDRLDYVLLQVEDDITQANGIKPVQYDLHPLNENVGMHILQHPEGGTMKLAINNNGIVQIYQNRGLVQYVTKAREGASGSPCFNEFWKVVALHHAERATAFGSVREGILFSSIYEEIKEFL